jgi:hypothetical protein
MSQPNILDICKVDLFTDKEELLKKYSAHQFERLVRLRDMYSWILENPSSSDRDFVSIAMSRHGIEKTRAYEDLGVIKALLPNFHKTARDFARWKYNEMILETYKMAKARKDTKTMERAATSYGKYNRIDVDDETELPFDLIVVQPFTATDDPEVLGIHRTPGIKNRIKELIEKYQKETIDIMDIDYEEPDLEEEELFEDYEDVTYGEKEGVL